MSDHIQILSEAIKGLPIRDSIISVSVYNAFRKVERQVHMTEGAFLRIFENFLLGPYTNQSHKISKTVNEVEFFALVDRKEENMEPRACTKKELFGGVK